MVEDIELAEIKKLATFIKDEFSYDFTNYALSSFKRRIIRIMELYKFTNADQIIQKLTKEPEFSKTLLSEITVNVTEMFRDPSLWRVLRDQIFPNLFQMQNEVKIWHAGCSSGEEVFSMCVLLEENGWLDKVKIFATDIDHVIIKKAKEGKYLLKNTQEVNDKNYVRFEGKGKLSDYYKIDGQNVIMEQNLLRNVTFREHDLVKTGWFSKFDIILCRNVMIYFNQTLQNEVFKVFHTSLFNYGYLIIGSKETLVWCDIANKFITVNNEEKIYKRVRE